MRGDGIADDHGTIQTGKNCGVQISVSKRSKPCHLTEPLSTHGDWIAEDAELVARHLAAPKRDPPFGSNPNEKASGERKAEQSRESQNSQLNSCVG